MESIKVMGRPLERVDGRLKVTGGVKYASDLLVENVAHGIIIVSTIPKGKITQIHVEEASKAPGVLSILTHQNALLLERIPFPIYQPPGCEGHGLLPLQDDIIHYSGQPIVVVTANTLSQARYAATLVRVEYSAEAAQLCLEEELDQAFAVEDMAAFGVVANTQRGELQDALHCPEVNIAQTYTTPMESHNPINPFAALALWDDSHLTVYDTTQAVLLTKEMLAATFNLPPNNVHVISTFVGGAFGAGTRPLPHATLAAMAAKKIGRPVKIVLTRQQMFTILGHRPPTLQRLNLSANGDGQLIAIKLEGFSQTSFIDEYVESLTASARMLYACPNVQTSYRLVRLNIGTPAYMRGPGESTGMFALESAMDELSYAIGIDPIDLRIRNYTAVLPDTNQPWSSNALKECYLQGAERIGWNRRTPQVRSLREKNDFIGMGMATSSYFYRQLPAQARVSLLADGSAIVQSATSDIGPGTYTVMTQIAADTLGLPMSHIRFELGDSDFPLSPPQIGSVTVSSVGPAVQEAAKKALEKIISIAISDEASPIYKAQTDAIIAKEGGLFLKDRISQGETFSELLTRNSLDLVEAVGLTEPDYNSHFASHIFGAHFAEVRVDAELGVISISRFVSAISAGSILNPKLARSQILGGIVWGIGMALQEETLLDQENGRIMNTNLADYHFPVHADILTPEVIFIDEKDEHINSLGAKGVGEIGIVGVAPAIANAVYHATGKRIRDLPITVDKLL